MLVTDVLFLLLRRFFRRRSLRRFLFIDRRPVIQVMGDVVALSAIFELCQHSRRMRCAMTVLALWHHLVFYLVTEGAREGLVLGLAGGEKV